MASISDCKSLAIKFNSLLESSLETKLTLIIGTRAKLKLLTVGSSASAGNLNAISSTASLMLVLAVSGSKSFGNSAITVEKFNLLYD